MPATTPICRDCWVALPHPLSRPYVYGASPKQRCSTPEHEATALKLGITYVTKSGKPVKIVQRNDMIHYETVLGNDGKYRYNRPGDRGRCTGASRTCSENLVVPRLSWAHRSPQTLK
jgi:hypothetical protein